MTASSSWTAADDSRWSQNRSQNSDRRASSHEGDAGLARHPFLRLRARQRTTSRARPREHERSARRVFPPLDFRVVGRGCHGQRCHRHRTGAGGATGTWCAAGGTASTTGAGANMPDGTGKPLGSRCNVGAGRGGATAMLGAAAVAGAALGAGYRDCRIWLRHRLNAWPHLVAAGCNGDRTISGRRADRAGLWSRSRLRVSTRILIWARLAEAWRPEAARSVPKRLTVTAVPAERPPSPERLPRVRPGPGPSQPVRWPWEDEALRRNRLTLAAGIPLPGLIPEACRDSGRIVGAATTGALDKRIAGQGRPGWIAQALRPENRIRERPSLRRAPLH